MHVLYCRSPDFGCNSKVFLGFKLLCGHTYVISDAIRYS